MKADIVTAPVYWASYLINGDPSSLDDEEIALCDAYFDGLGDVVDVSEESERFTWSYDLYGDPRYRGGTVADYTVLT